jgi:putative transcription factor
MQCELCGRDSPVLLLTEIEGSRLSLCKGCAAHGKVIRVVQRPIIQEKKSFAHVEPKQETEVIVDGFGEKIKEARERANLKQEELAKAINEKESLIHALETGHHHPNLELAKKFERYFKIPLTEKLKEEQIMPSKGPPGGLTLGDFIKVKQN